jgi:hypothetical protein
MHIYSIAEEVIGMDYPSTLPIPLFIMGISFLFTPFFYFCPLFQEHNKGVKQGLHVVRFSI